MNFEGQRLLRRFAPRNDSNEGHCEERSNLCGKASRLSCRLCCPQRISAPSIGKDILCGIPIHSLTTPHRVAQTSHFMLEDAELLSRLGMNNILKAILMGIAFLRNQTPIFEKLMRTREI